MTDQQCGASHHRFPETLCIEPAGHYRPDRDPHAGPLIIDGRERGGAAWDEPKDTRMTDRPSLEDLDAVPEPARWCCAGNAEDCPLCDTAALPYPWICPGHPDTPANRARARKAAEDDEPVDSQEIAAKARKVARLWQQWNARNVARLHDAQAALARVEQLAARIEAVHPVQDNATSLAAAIRNAARTDREAP